MKKKRSYKKSYEERFNKVTNSKECFRLFDELKNENPKFSIVEFIDNVMYESLRLGKREVYNRFVEIRKFWLEYYTFNIRNIDYTKDLSGIEDYKKHLSNKKELVTNKKNYTYIRELNNIINDLVKHEHIIIDPNDNLSYHINKLSELIDIRECEIAVGYLYDSGLHMIGNMLDRVFQDGNKIRCIVGSLQNYYKGTTKKKVDININLETVKLLNYYSTLNMDIRTLKEKFYHGKMFILKGKEISCVIVGSANISKSAFCKNYELNELIIFRNNYEKYNIYSEYFNSLWDRCYTIDMIDSSIINFIKNNEIDGSDELDFVETNCNYICSNVINDLDDNDIKLRFELWLDKKPDNIYKDINAKSLLNYFAFEYKDYNLIVLDSSYIKNGYYYFYNYNFEELIKVIKDFTKTEIFELSSMKKRGYHIYNTEKLKNNLEDL